MEVTEWWISQDESLKLNTQPEKRMKILSSAS